MDALRAGVNEKGILSELAKPAEMGLLFKIPGCMYIAFQVFQYRK